MIKKNVFKKRIKETDKIGKQPQPMARPDGKIQAPRTGFRNRNTNTTTNTNTTNKAFEDYKRSSGNAFFEEE